MKTLKILAWQISCEIFQDDQNPEITSLIANSRMAKPGSLFIALPGLHVDGREFAKSAIEKGAVAILTNAPIDLPVPQLIVPDVRKAAALLVPFFYDYPGKQLRMIGVTGTNGKTTTTCLIHHILQQAGQPAGLIGTISSRIGDREIPSVNTTPDVTELQGLLAEMQNAGLSRVVMEVSSHALAMDRVIGCEFDTAIFTNLTQDHLDYHGTLDAYQEAKMLLFSKFMAGQKKNKRSIINYDDSVGTYFKEASIAPVWTYGYQVGADFQVLESKESGTGTWIKINSPEGQVELQSPLLGDFNVYNVLSAALALRAEGVSWAEINAGLATFPGVPGRFERVSPPGAGPLVIVDYAHTPDGLKNVLSSARKSTKGKLVAVFGCGGDRDRTKRPLMGRIGASLADLTILTSDNPRSEDPEAILKDILAAWENPDSDNPLVIADREEAIITAIRQAKPGDTVLIAGKGHETYQILKDKTIDFDDKKVAIKTLEE